MTDPIGKLASAFGVSGRAGYSGHGPTGQRMAASLSVAALGSSISAATTSTRQLQLSLCLSLHCSQLSSTHPPPSPTFVTMTVVDALILNPKVTQSMALLATTLGRDKASLPRPSPAAPTQDAERWFRTPALTTPFHLSTDTPGLPPHPVRLARDRVVGRPQRPHRPGLALRRPQGRAGAGAQGYVRSGRHL